MRAVAQALGVTDAALYHHFPNRDALLEAVVAKNVEKFPLPDDDGEWAEWVRRFADKMRESLLKAPGTAEVVGRMGPAEASMLRVVEAFAQRLVDAGFSVRDAAQVYSMITSYVVAFVGRQQALENDPRKRQAADVIAAVEAAPEASPLLREVAESWRDSSWDKSFEFGLARIIDGLRASGWREQP